MSNRALVVLFAAFVMLGVTTCSDRPAAPRIAAREFPAPRARPCLIGPSCYEPDARLFEPCLAATDRCPGDVQVTLAERPQGL